MSTEPQLTLFRAIRLVKRLKGRMAELSQRAAIANRLFVAPAPEPASQRIDEATKGGSLHRRIIRRKRPGRPGEGTTKEEGMR